MNISNTRRSVSRSLLTLLAIAGGFSFAKPAAGQGVLTVSLLQMSTGIATSGTQTIINGDIVVSGSLPSSLSTSAFATLLSWSTASVGVTGTNLYTVNGSGSPSFSASAVMTVDGAGFLYATASPETNMNKPAENQRQIAITAVDPYPTLPAGTFSDLRIAQIRFAVSPDISNAIFNFSLNGTPATYGFTDNNFDVVGFANGGGSFHVTPEPSTIASALFGGIGILGSCLLRSRRNALRRGASVAA